MAQSLILKIRGLFTNANELSEAPEGALTTADNIVINRDSIAECRRGFVRLEHSLPDAADKADKLFQYQDTLLFHYTGNKLAYYDDSSPTVYQFTVSSANATAGDTYTNNGKTFTVTSTIASGTTLMTTGTGAPTSSGTLTRATGSGDATITFSAVSAGIVTYSGTYAHPDSSLAKIRSAEANSNFYFTSTNGIKKLDSYDSTPTMAGMYKGLDLQVSTYTNAAGFMDNDTQVAYRMLWGKTDANDNLVLGAPSQRAVVTNSSGSNKDVSVQITIPEGITTDYFFQVYRSDQSASASTEAADTMKLIYEASPTSGEITAKSLTFVDSVPDSLRGAALYTNDTQEGLLQSNELPPYAYDMAVFRDCLFFGNTRTKQRLQFSILAIGGSGGIVDGNTQTIAGTTYTAADGTGSASYEFTITSASATSTAVYQEADSGGNLYYRFTVTAATASAGDTYTNNGQTFTVVTTISGGTTLVTTGTGAPTASGNLVRATGAGTDPIVFSAVTTYSYTVSSTISSATTLVTTGPKLPNSSGKLVKLSGTGDATITYSAVTTEVVSARQYKLYTSGSASQNIADTALSMIRVINKNSTNTTVYAYYQSAYDELPGKILIEERTLGGASFAATASARGSAFSPALPTSGTTVSSSNSINLNGLMYSKAQQPDAVPLGNIMYVGSASKRILRILALRDSLFILKEDGVYRVTGAGPGSFSVDLLDNTAILLAPESAVTLNNRIFCLTTQGICAIADTGVEVLSKPIEDQILNLVATARDAVQYYSFGVGYESDRKYIFWTVSSDADTYATQAFVYNFFTKSWTRWVRNQSHAIVLGADDKIYATDPSANYINQERKLGTYHDYVDEAISVTLSSFSGTDVVLSDVSEITVGDLLYQSTEKSSLITAINTNTSTVTVADTITWSLSDPTYYIKSIACTLEWVPNAAQNPGMLKHWPEATVLLKENTFADAYLKFYSDVSGSWDEVPITGAANNAWGRFAWGEAPWGGVVRSTPLRTYVPRDKQRCDLLSVQFYIREAWAKFQIEGISLVTRGLSPRVMR